MGFWEDFVNISFQRIGGGDKGGRDEVEEIEERIYRGLVG